MCGIAGLWLKNGIPQDSVLNTMLAALSHRGPDGHGVHIEEGLALLHTRLAIIDVIGGHQPLFDDRGNCLVVNGEIYNFVELRTQFKTYPYKTHSDCETIFPLYQNYGPDFVTHLRGMFAISLFDKSTKTLYLARDPFGIKPLYYAILPQGFIYASEPQAILASGLVSKELHEGALSDLMHLRYTTSAETIYKGIYRILPGEMLVIQNGKIIDRSHQEALPKGPPQKMTYDEAFSTLDQIMRDSLKVHLRSDVPYGLFLSGGVDSSTLLALMHEEVGSGIRTFTVGFPGTQVHDERAMALRVSQKLGTHHKEISYSENDFWNETPQVIKALDDPTLDFATLPTYHMSKVAAQDVKVVLCGEGGDEILSGYARHRRARFFGRILNIFMKKRGLMDRVPILKYDQSEWKTKRQEDEKLAKLNHYSPLQQNQFLDTRNWLPDDLLIKTDRCLMAHGIEGRTPFLDKVVAQGVFNFPDDLKIQGKKTKWIMRKWLEKHLPESEPFAKKRGFTVPVGEWISTRGKTLGELVARQNVMNEYFLKDKIPALFKSSDKHQLATSWNLLSFALWYKIHFEDASAQGSIEEVLSSS
ncbi:Asparagine synthetase [glutamine-hydrolyzing] 1 [Candidatus Bealeia paramacronuclearis]|uniref:asparagine synthase (glutamine-hydrolyzing) n=1 Tax=Candidatus Bealeia paramacronuclearis TaxID=1921001 RepID=A0ABZ2C2S6_9PROT|nr:Asparagine synthetase [glutamine-hydrolyzing] 1 [Candidatus Bealeia paramacronuclearis]